MTDHTPTFIADGWHIVHSKKHGDLTVYTGRCPADFRDRSVAQGFKVMFNGRPRFIRFLESFAKFEGPCVGEQVGLVFHD